MEKYQNFYGRIRKGSTRRGGKATSLQRGDAAFSGFGDAAAVAAAEAGELAAGMEGLLRLSKLKLQLLALISENKDLRERERCAREELRLSVQRQREAEAESTGKLQELRAELASRDALQRKLETRIKCLENDNILLEKKQQELRVALDNVLKSRDTFVNIYKDSTCALKIAIEIRDRKLSILSDKIQRHLSLFDSIEKEAEAVKETVDSIQKLVSEKEQIGM